MGTQVVGTASMSSTATGSINLGTPLHDVKVRDRKNRRTLDTLDLQAREVVSYGGGRWEIEGLVRFHNNAQELLNFIRAGLDGDQVTYTHGSTHSAINAKLIAAGDVEPDKDRAGLGEYQVRLTFRTVADNDDWSAIL